MAALFRDTLFIILILIGIVYTQDNGKRGCGPPDAVENAEPKDPELRTKVEFQHEEKVQYKCREGMRYYGFNVTVTCLNGEWTKADFECEWIPCGYLDHPENGRRIDMNNQPSTFTHFECNEGYEMIGSDRVFCRVGGTWRHGPPSCRVVMCPDPRAIRHGSIFQTSLDGVYNDFGSEVTYTCDENYKIEGLSKRRCMADGRWEGEEPNCIAAVCPPFFGFKNGKVEYDSDEIIAGSMAFIECDPHADLDPPDAEDVMCLISEEWTATPKCWKRAYLPKDNKKYGPLTKYHNRRNIVRAEWIRHGVTITFSCSGSGKFELYRNGHYKDTQYVRSRNDNGKWSYEIPVCKESRCRVGYVANGRVTYENGTTASGLVESRLKLHTKCDDKYQVEFRRPSKNTCRRGKLNSPRCEGKSCPLSKKPNFTDYSYSYDRNRVRKNNVRHGDTVTITCSHNGYELVRRDGEPVEYLGSSVEIQCNFGQFQDKLPQCEEKRCSLWTLRNKYKSLTDKTSRDLIQANGYINSGTVIMVKCKMNHQFINRPSLKTTEIKCNKGLLENVLECEPVPCDVPDVINGRVMVESNQIKHEEKKTAACNEGFEFRNGKDAIKLTCNYGNISKSDNVSLNCTEKKCRIGDIVGVEYMDIIDDRIKDGKVNSRTTLKPTCKRGYEQTHQGKSDMFCSKGEWNGDLKCNAKNCPKPAIPYATFEPNHEKDFDHGKQVQVICDEGYAFNGNQDKFDTQCILGDFNPKPPGKCSEKMCSIKELEDIKYEKFAYINQTRVEDDHVESKLQILTKCLDGYEVTRNVSVTPLRCNKGVWNSSIPCKPKSCPKNLVGDLATMTIRDVSDYSLFDDEIIEDDRVKSGETVEVECNAGYQLEAGTEATVECNLGIWNESINCIPKRCSETELRNTYKLVIKEEVEDGHVKSGTMILTACTKGFSMPGKQQTDSIWVTCDKGNWTDAVLCEQVLCQKPDVKNAEIIKPRNMYNHDEKVEALCDDGFEFSNGEVIHEIKCVLGELSPDSAFECTEKNCSIMDISNQNNTIIKDKDGKLLDEIEMVKSMDTVLLQCEDDYESDNGKGGKVTCQKGDWIGRTIDCVPKRCKVPNVKGANIFTFPELFETEQGDPIANESSIYIQCPAGSRLDGVPVVNVSTQLTCVLGDWDSSIPTGCRSNSNIDMEGKCLIEVPEHADITVGNKPLLQPYINNGQRLKLECHRGFDIIGGRDNALPSFTTRCNNMKLTRPLPFCRKKKDKTRVACKLPNQKIYTVVGDFNKQNGYVPHKTKATVQCPHWDTGLEVECINRIWNPSVPKCEAPAESVNTECRLPDDVYVFDNGDLSPEDTVPHGTVTKVDCFEELFNYDDSMQNNILCEEGNFVNFEDVKLNLYCAEVLKEGCEKVRNGNVKMTFGVIDVTCDPGYTLNVPTYNDIQCENGKLKTKYGRTVKCDADSCKLPEILGYLQVQDYKGYQRGSYLSGSKTVEHKHRVLVDCSAEGHEPSNRVLQCREGQWVLDAKERWEVVMNGSFPECRKAKCEPRCKNSGTCIRDNKCKCLVENYGDRCEKYKCPAKCLANGGSCPDSNACQCPEGKTGKNCEIVVCQPKCENSGQCIENNKCECLEEHYGDRCEKFRCSDECTANGGSCPDSNECKCTGERTGTNCEIVPCEPKCQNSGKCVKNNKCECQKGTFGDRCEQFECNDECIRNGGSCPYSTQCVCPIGKVGPNCQHTKCRSPATNATIPNVAMVYNVGARISDMTCKSNYKLDGDTTLTCLKNGTWSGTVRCIQRKRIQYRIRVTTGSWTLSGTNGDIFLKIVGEDGNTGETELTNDLDGRINKFTPSSTDTFHLFLHDVGKISSISVYFDVKFWKGWWWYPTNIYIYDFSRQQYYFFLINQWLWAGTPVERIPYRGEYCGEQFSKPVTIYITDTKRLINGGKTRDDIECKMICTEYIESYCAGVIYRDGTKECFVVRANVFPYLKTATPESKNNVTYYSKILCQ